MIRYGLALIAALSLALPALGDEIIFKNGDRLTGTITEADAGKVTINTTLAGPLSAPMSEIKTFSTDAPVTLKMRDGNVITDKIVHDENGMISVGGTGTVKRQSVALVDIAKINEAPPHWTGSIAVGGILTQGNSKTESFNANFDAVRRSEDDRITFDAGYFFANQKQRGSNERTTTTDNWFVSGKYDYFFTKKLYGYGLAKVERDRVANLDIRFTPGAGVGYQWVESPDFNFRTEGGVSWVYQNRITPGFLTKTSPLGSRFHPPTEHSEDHVAVRLAYHVDKRLNDKVTVYHDFEYLPDVQDITVFNANADAGVRFAISKNMFSELRAEWRYDSSPSHTNPKTYKNDVRYLLNVGCTF